MWDLISLTRDRTCIVCLGRLIFNHWTTREDPSAKLFDTTEDVSNFQEHIPHSLLSHPWQVWMTIFLLTSFWRQSGLFLSCFSEFFQLILLPGSKCISAFLVNPKGNQPWIFSRRTDVEAEAPILWPHDVTNQLIRKDPDAGKDWGQEEKGATEDEMVGGHHRLNGHEFEQTPGDSKVQGSLACCSPRGHRQSDAT